MLTPGQLCTFYTTLAASGLLEVFGDDAFPDPCLRTGEGQQGVSFEVVDLLPGVSPSPA